MIKTQQHRIFIAINLPEEVKTSLADYQNKWQELPMRWTKSENLHITLIFIGDTDEREILGIKQVLENVIVRQKSFSVVLSKISYSPYKRDKESPRMIWAVGEKSEEFLALKKDLETAILKLKRISFIQEKRESVPHITLARIKEWGWRRIEPDERPEIEEFVNFSILVGAIELMESVFKRGGVEYKILESFSLLK